MIPYNQVTATVVQKNMLVTTSWEVSLMLVCAVIITTLYWLVILLLNNKRFNAYLTHTHQHDKYDKWNEERKQQIRKWGN